MRRTIDPALLLHGSRERSRQNGFSMAEVLVAVALLAFIILAVFGLVTAGVKQAFGGKKMTEATVLAQSVLDRANTRKPQDLLGAVDGNSTASYTWSRNGTTVTPAAESSGTGYTTRNIWRTLLANADLPSSSSHNTTLTVTMTAVPSGDTFGNCSMVQIIVDVIWWEYGSRPRQVRLQTMNLSKIPS